MRRRRVRTLIFLALLHPLNGSMTAPPVSPDRARSRTDRIAPQLGGAMGAVFAIQSKLRRICSQSTLPAQGLWPSRRAHRPGPTGRAVTGRLRECSRAQTTRNMPRRRRARRDRRPAMALTGYLNNTRTCPSIANRFTGFGNHQNAVIQIGP